MILLNSILIINYNFMSIKVICSGCNANFEFKDELAWKKWKCPNCWTIIEIPNLENSTNNNKTENQTIKTNENSIFSHNIYGIKQKKIAINEKYYIKDKDNNDILFALRKVYLIRKILSIFTFIFVVVLFIFIWWFIWLYNELIIMINIIFWIFVGIYIAILISPKKHIRFFKDDKDLEWEAEFEIKEDSKFQIINKTFTMLNKEKEIICKFRKNIFTDIIRKKWHMEFDWKHIEIKEDSIILWLLRRFIPYGKFIRTNFIFTDFKKNNNLWIFKRKFELFDNYTLDLSNDIVYNVPRKLAIWMSILLDTWEKR